jgi:hypothetical protein
MIFYRIENCDGNGPYSAARFEWTRKAHNKDNGCPAAHEDVTLDKCMLASVIEDSPKGIFGFRTMEQLHAWFLPGEIRILDRNDFKIREVHGELIAETPSQCYFWRT